MTVRARRLLTTPEAAEAFLVDLSAKLEDAANANVCPKFDDFDISQNPLSSDNFTALFGMFIDKGVGIQRMRLFGCATLDDTVAWQMAGWLSSLTQDTVPSEMHLSDCAITSEGFTAICDAFASNDAFPPRNGTTGAVCPMYMRLENNYIEQHVIQQKIEEGVLTYFMKNCGAPPNPNAKVKILVQMAGRFSQRAGQPPPPELAPPPKPVNDKNIVHGMPNAVRPVRPVMAASPVAQGMPMQQNLSPQLMTMQQKNSSASDASSARCYSTGRSSQSKPCGQCGSERSSRPVKNTSSCIIGVESRPCHQACGGSVALSLGGALE